MAWERRGSHRYFYIGRRINGKVRKFYIGKAHPAEFAAGILEERNANRRLIDAELLRVRQDLAESLAQAADFSQTATNAFEQKMDSLGFHNFRGRGWRKRRTHRGDQ